MKAWIRLVYVLVHEEMPRHSDNDKDDNDDNDDCDEMNKND
jgi:hypothetical protein